MASSPGFSFSHFVEDVLAELSPVIQLDEAGQRALASALSMMVDRDRDVEDFLTQTLSGLKGKEVQFTAAAGGAVISFGQSFSRAPTVFVTMVTAGGYTANVVNASTTSAQFQVQVYLGGVEQAAGTFIINWLAMG